MNEALMTYFNGEKYAGLFLTAMATAVIAAAFLLPRMRSFSVTLVVLAVVEIAIGVGLYLRTDPQVSNLVTQLGSDPASFYTEENARMERVQRNFVYIEYAELAIIILAAIAAVALKQRHALVGVALGLLIHTALLLAFDIIAERRGAVYLQQLVIQPTHRGA